METPRKRHVDVTQLPLPSLTNDRLPSGQQVSAWIADGRKSPKRWAFDAIRLENHRLVEQGQKRCRRCGEIKALSDFNRWASQRYAIGGVQNYCKPCSSVFANKHFRQRRYGMTIEEYQQTLAAQNFSCAICGMPGKSPDTVTRSGDGSHSEVLHVDHDHATGKVRGLLCEDCNQGLGRFKDSPDTLHSAIRYLKRSAK